jgi:hypothetical protein
MSVGKTVFIPFYATVLRADGLEEALMEIGPVSLRYGASNYTVYRSGDDRYRFHTYFQFETKLDWERFWYGPEFNDWRARYSSWYQVPTVYDMGSIVDQGATEVEQDVHVA